MEYKQVLSKRCRTCNHTLDFHYHDYGFPARVSPAPCKDSRCKCKEYLPLDNLEYLEHMNEHHTSL